MGEDGESPAPAGWDGMNQFLSLCALSQKCCLLQNKQQVLGDPPSPGVFRARGCCEQPSFHELLAESCCVLWQLCSWSSSPPVSVGLSVHLSHRPCPS